jgi:hypothetical protein
MMMPGMVVAGLPELSSELEQRAQQLKQYAMQTCIE